MFSTNNLLTGSICPFCDGLGSCEDEPECGECNGNGWVTYNTRYDSDSESYSMTGTEDELIAWARKHFKSLNE